MTEEMEFREFKYRNGRRGFLAKKDGLEFNLTLNIDSVNVDYLIMRTYGKSEELAKIIMKNLVDRGVYEVLRKTEVGFNTAVVLAKVVKE